MKEPAGIYSTRYLPAIRRIILALLANGKSIQTSTEEDIYTVRWWS